MEEMKISAPVCKPKKENKSKHVHMLIKPTTYKLVQDECARLGISVNDAINQLLENWLDELTLSKKG